MANNPRMQNEKPWQQWELQQVVTPKIVGLLLLMIVLLGFSARNTEMDKAAYKTGEAILAVVGLSKSCLLYTSPSPRD